MNSPAPALSWPVFSPQSVGLGRYRLRAAEPPDAAHLRAEFARSYPHSAQGRGAHLTSERYWLDACQPLDVARDGSQVLLLEHAQSRRLVGALGCHLDSVDRSIFVYFVFVVPEERKSLWLAPAVFPLAPAVVRHWERTGAEFAFAYATLSHTFSQRFLGHAGFRATGVMPGAFLMSAAYGVEMAEPRATYRENYAYYCRYLNQGQSFVNQRVRLADAQLKKIWESACGSGGRRPRG